MALPGRFVTIYRGARPYTAGQETSSSSTTDGLKATLKSDNRLTKNTQYEVVVTTGAQDLAGNRLDQIRTQPNNQPMEWTFTTGSS